MAYSAVVPTSQTQASPKASPRRGVGTKAGCLVLICLLWFGAFALRAADRYVATNGTDSGDCTNWATAASNIQFAVNLASNVGDTVWVSNGVYETGGVTNCYTGNLLTNRVAITRAIIVRSANNDPTNTIIKGRFDTGGWRTPGAVTNGPSAVRCVYMSSGAMLIGFRLTNGATMVDTATPQSEYLGGGMCAPNSAPGVILSNCVIAGNAAGDGGGANIGNLYNCIVIGNWTSAGGGGTESCNMSNCTIVGNTSQSGTGGGVRNGTLYNCTVISNSAVSYGGGMAGATLYDCTIVGNSSANYAGGAYAGTMYNCLVIGNYAASYGGGAYNTKLYNCTIVGNDAGNDGGGMRQDSGGPVVNCIVYSNNNHNWHNIVSFTNCCTTPTNGLTGTGNITNDPMFISYGTGYGLSHVAGNYRLRTGSPCINTGTNQGGWMTTYYDLDGRLRIRYGIVDMGAYERINEGIIYNFR